MDKVQFVLKNTSFKVRAVENVISLSDEGSSVPFIARYRKEQTGDLDEVEIQEILKWSKTYTDLVHRKKYILETIEAQGQLTDGIRSKIENTYDLEALEDLYLPYKRKKQSRAEKARALGLEGLAQLIMDQKHPVNEGHIKPFSNKAAITIDEALQGAKDIIAEWVSEDVPTRDFIRQQLRQNGLLTASVSKGKREEAQTYRDYFDFNQRISKIPSHRFMAINRGVTEGLLSSSIEVDEEYIHRKVLDNFLRNRTNAEIISESVSEALKRLLLPSLENQVMKEFQNKADVEAIQVFSENLRQILLSPPIGEKAVLGVDPGFRTGCKIVCLSNHGELLEYTTIFPTAPQNDFAGAANEIHRLYSKFNFKAIVIGNGTASRETRSFFENVNIGEDVEIVVVSESGASIYSASEIAREEFPKLDLTYRGAVSIGRRALDPLAELVKIDPKSIGVGQYQHDVDQTRLKEKLDETIISCVNKVGVNLNTASKYLLQYISGLGPTLANSIIEHRKKSGGIHNKKELLKIPRLGPKSFEQCAGFLRVKGGDNPLDNTGIHPDTYPLVEKIAKQKGLKTNDIIGNKAVLKDLDPAQFIDANHGIPTVRLILEELAKPGMDPRGAAESFEFSSQVKDIDDLEIGMILPAIIGNITKFGAFADIGIKENGLIHISEITHKFISDPAEVLKLNQKLYVKIIGIDKDRKRIQLSVKDV